MTYIYRTFLIGLSLAFSMQGRADDIVTPQVSDSSTVFDRIVALYNQGHMPDWTDFDPSNDPIGQAVKKFQPNTFQIVKLISLESGDAIIGQVRRAHFFIEMLDGKHLTIEIGQDCLIGQGICSGGIEVSPLTADLKYNAFVSSTPARSDSCSASMRFRKVALPNNTKAIVGITVLDDPRRECNPTNEGSRSGDIAFASYVVVP
ncbi:MAG: hypothetical protein NTV34_12345 [Proteobacteria bacterium]|nr:hypothetical protein [Pseudomonadota bacterium]